MVKLGIFNSRMKDFYDIRVLSDIYSFNGELLADSIKSTFTNRDTEIPEVPMFMQNSFRVDPQKQIQWKAFIRKNKFEEYTADFLSDNVDSSSLVNFVMGSHINWNYFVILNNKIDTDTIGNIY